VGVMGRAEEHIRVVVVSPGDVARERVAAQVVVDELNRGVAQDRGCRLSLWRWEIDAGPRMHMEGPQGLIDELMKIREADVVVGVFWKRFGTPTGRRTRAPSMSLVAPGRLGRSMGARR
jgi:hypothetical protein